MNRLTSSMAPNLLLAAMIMSGLLTGCQSDPVPIAAKEIAASEFPDDGKIHVQYQGKIIISPSTEICHYRGSYGFNGVYLRRGMKINGQSENLPSGRVRLNSIIGESVECDSENSVNIYGYQSRNRRGSPYKITYIIWQKEHYWVGIIERKNGLRPGLKIPSFGATLFGAPIVHRRTLEKSRAADFNDLEKAFVADLNWSRK